MKAPKGVNETEPKKDPLLELEQELELLKQILLREIIAKAKSGQGVNEDLLKKLRSYLKVLERLIPLLQRKSQEEKIANALSVRLVWDLLTKVPKLGELISDPKIKAQILKQIKERLKEIKN